ncbi:CEN-like protein 2 [Tanacetum coccineum]
MVVVGGDGDGDDDDVMVVMTVVEAVGDDGGGSVVGYGGSGGGSVVEWLPWSGTAWRWRKGNDVVGSEVGMIVMAGGSCRNLAGVTLKPTLTSDHPLVIGRVVGDVVDPFVPSVNMYVMHKDLSNQVYNGHERLPPSITSKPRVDVHGGDLRPFFTQVSS